MKSNRQKSFKSIVLESIFPVKGLFPEGEGNEAVVELLYFLHLKKVKIEGGFHYGVPGPSVNLKCFLPEQSDSHQRDQIISKIKETKDILAPLDGWVLDASRPFPQKSMDTKQIRFEVRFEKPMPGWAPRKWRKDYQDFMLNDYPKIVEKHDLGVAEDMREAAARETGMYTYMKNRKIDRLVDSIDTANKLNEFDLIFAFGTLVSMGEPTSSAVDKIKGAAKRQGCSEVMIDRSLEMYGDLTGNILSGSDNNSSKPSQGEEDS